MKNLGGNKGKKFNMWLDEEVYADFKRFAAENRSTMTEIMQKHILDLLDLERKLDKIYEMKGETRKSLQNTDDIEDFYFETGASIDTSIDNGY